MSSSLAPNPTMIKSLHILIILVKSNASNNFENTFQKEGYDCQVSYEIKKAIGLLKKELYHFILLDEQLNSAKQKELVQFVEAYCPDSLVLPIAMKKSSDLDTIKLTINRLSRSILERNKDKVEQKEILEMAKDLQESNQRLMSQDTKKNRCLAVATHELRTPITIVNGYLKLLLSESFGEVNEKQRHLLRESSHYCSHLIKLVNSMLDRCRLDSGNVAFEYKRGYYLARVLKVISQMESYIEECGLTLSVEIPEEDDIFYFDPNALEQTLINLIGNAVKFTPPPGKITIRCEMEPNGVLTQVIDTGVGIQGDEIERVFDEFNTVGKQHGEKKGAGLGLSICKRIIEAHHGSIWVESRAGKGSCLSFKLPREFLDVTKQ